MGGRGGEWGMEVRDMIISIKTNSAAEIREKKRNFITKGVSFGPQMRASQVKKSDSEIGPE